MKKGTKIGLGLGALLIGSLLLSGCTASFCSTVDKAHILYVIDHGVCEYYDSQEEAVANAKQNGAEGGYVAQLEGTNVWYNASLNYCGSLQKIYNNANNQLFGVPTLKYYIAFDEVVLEHAIEAYALDTGNSAATLKAELTAEKIGSAREKSGYLFDYGYLKFYGPSTNSDGTVIKESKKLYVNWGLYNNEVRMTKGVPVDECPTQDYVNYYQSQLKTMTNSYRACLAPTGGTYGKYGAEGLEAEIQEKNFGWAWKWKDGQGGLLSGLIVWPIGALIDVLARSFTSGVGAGWAQLLAILIVTVIVRSLMLLATFKQTTASSKMQELQPEIAKIQAKHPNSNTNNYERQRLAAETQALYKKHKINPFTSIIVMIVQFPIFICVWGAMQGSAILSSDSVLGLNLSTSISSVLTTWSNWSNPASGVWTALGLFLLMAGAQTVAMLLPQWLQKAKKQKLAKLGRNPAQKENDNKMKWFTYIMLAMIIFMGFSLVSALGVYWLVGALFSIAQTLITHAIMNRNPKKR